MGDAVPAGGRLAFAHEATLAMAPAGDTRAPGAEITLALCGSWSHDPPCPLAPHHTAAERAGELVSLRVLFAATPADEARVRLLVDAALAGGSVAGPAGTPASWRLVTSAPAELQPGEREHGRRLTLS